MKTTARRVSALAVAGATVLGVARVEAADIWDLGVVNGSPFHVTDVNASGVAVGSQGSQVYQVAGRNGRPTAAGTLKASRGAKINDAGVVAAAVFVGDAYQAATYDAVNKTVPLGRDGFTASYATAINNRGDVAGFGTPTGGGDRAMLAPAGTTPRSSSFKSIGRLDGTSARPSALSNAGHVAGRVTLASKAQEVFVLDANGSPTPYEGLQVEVAAVNNSGQAVGSGVVNSQLTSLLFSGGTTITIGHLPGDHESVATDVTNDGVTVGTSRRRGRDPNNPANTNKVLAERPFLLRANDAGAAMVDLDAWLDAQVDDQNVSLGRNWVLNTAVAVTDNGFIAGMGLYNGATRGYVLDASELIVTPTLAVPEPAAALGGLGMLGLVASRRRHR